MKFPLVPFAVLCLAAGSFAIVPTPSTPALTSAAAESNFVSVSTVGIATAAPSFYSMKATLSATADLADESVMDFAQARTRAVGGINDAGLFGLEVKGAGVEFVYGPPQDNNMNNGFIMSSNGSDTIGEGVTMKEILDVQFTPDGDAAAQQGQVAQAIDIAVELGLKLKGGVNVPYYGYPVQNNGDGNATISGKLSEEDQQTAQAAAQADAMQRARVLAENLAALSGRELGAVRSVRQTATLSRWKGVGAGVEVTASLSVEFELK